MFVKFRPSLMKREQKLGKKKKKKNPCIPLWLNSWSWTFQITIKPKMSQNQLKILPQDAAYDAFCWHNIKSIEIKYSRFHGNLKISGSWLDSLKLILSNRIKEFLSRQDSNRSINCKLLLQHAWHFVKSCGWLPHFLSQNFKGYLKIIMTKPITHSLGMLWYEY